MPPSPAGVDRTPPGMPAGFRLLQRRGSDPAGQIGCLFILAAPSLFPGLGTAAVFVIDPAG
jgi:hypothetical protein